MRDFFKPGIDDVTSDSSIYGEDFIEELESISMDESDDDSSLNNDSSFEEDSDDSDYKPDQSMDNNPKPSTSSGNDEQMILNEEEEEDETIKSIVAAIKKPRIQPPDIKHRDFITDISFHPEENIIAIASISGDVLLYKYDNEENTLIKKIEVHEKSCRDVEFSEDGKYILTASKDKSIMITDIETEKLKNFYNDAHNKGLYKLYVIDENLFSTGDDEGTVKLWDCRTEDPIFSLKEVDDYISSMLTNDAKKLLLVTSGDGYLTTINIAARKLYVQSEPYEEELTCMGLYRNDSRLVVGTSKGRLYTYNWGQFGYHTDMYPGLKTAINVMIPITDRIGCFAGEEGVLRASHIAPFRTLGVVGQHALPIEAMDINNSGELLASCSFDNDVKFWNIKYFEDFRDIKYNEKHNSFKELKHNLPSSKYSNTADFFADLANSN